MFKKKKVEKNITYPFYALTSKAKETAVMYMHLELIKEYTYLRNFIEKAKTMTPGVDNDVAVFEARCNIKKLEMKAQNTETYINTYEFNWDGTLAK